MIHSRRSASWCRPAAVVSLATLGGLHAWWATGSPWPLRSRAAFADAVMGNARFPPPTACLAVAGLLASAAGLVAGHPRRYPRLSRAGVGGVVVVLSVRGAAGVTGMTDHLARGANSDRFRSLDRRVYAPICFTLAALCAGAAKKP